MCSARKAGAVDLGAAADTIGEKVLCNADCVAKVDSSQKVSAQGALAKLYLGHYYSRAWLSTISH